MRHSWKCAMRRYRYICMDMQLELELELEMRMSAPMQLLFLSYSLKCPSPRVAGFPSFLAWFTGWSIVNGCRWQSIRSIRSIPCIHIYFLAPTSRLPNSPSQQKSDSLVRISDSGWMRVIWSLVCGSLISLLQRRLPRLLCIDKPNETGESSSPFSAKNIFFDTQMYLAQRCSGITELSA